MGDFHLGGYKVDCVKLGPGYLAIFVKRTTLVYIFYNYIPIPRQNAMSNISLDGQPIYFCGIGI